MIITICLITWYVPPAGVVELAAEVLAEPRQVWLPVWHCLPVRGVEQHLGIGGAASTLDLLQESSTFCVVGRENLETTHKKGTVIRIVLHYGISWMFGDIINIKHQHICTETYSILSINSKFVQ